MSVQTPLDRITNKTVASATPTSNGLHFNKLAGRSHGLAPELGNESTDDTKATFDIGANQVTTPKGGKCTYTTRDNTVERGN